MKNPLDAEDAITVVLTYDELQTLVRALEAGTAAGYDYPELRPVIDKFSRATRCQHLEWATGLIDVSACKACGVLT